MGQVAYQLEFSHAKIHHTFHVSQLKGKIGASPIVPHLLVSLSVNGHIHVEPEAIVDRKVIQKNHKEMT